MRKGNRVAVGERKRRLATQILMGEDHVADGVQVAGGLLERILNPLPAARILHAKKLVRERIVFNRAALYFEDEQAVIGVNDYEVGFAGLKKLPSRIVA